MIECYFGKLQQLYTEVRAFHDKLNKMQSALDQKVSSLYHELEKSEFSIAEGQEFTRTLKETLQMRRVVKQEIALIMPVYNMLKEQTGRVDEQYSKAARRVFAIQESLNVTMNLQDVFTAMEIE